MHLIKNILGRLFAFWTVLVFIITMFIFFLPMWAAGLWKEPKRSYIMHIIFRIWMRIFFFFSGIRLKIKGRENFKKGENYIIVYNHNSLMDVPVSFPFTRGANKTIAKSEMASIPIFGMFYKRGSVLVNRKSEESRKQSYTKMKDVLDLGLHMCIYPEGTRNKTKEPLQRFHDGAFKLALDSGKAIMPALIFNSAKVLPRKAFFFWPAKMELHFLEPIPLSSFSSVEQLKTHVFELMKAYYVRNKK